MAAAAAAAAAQRLSLVCDVCTWRAKLGVLRIDMQQKGHAMERADRARGGAMATPWRRCAPGRVGANK